MAAEDKITNDGTRPGAAALGPVNLNTASAEELRSVVGLGDGRVAEILEWRESKGRFETVDDLQKLPHIGPGDLPKLRDQLTV